MIMSILINGGLPPIVLVIVLLSIAIMGLLMWFLGSLFGKDFNFYLDPTDYASELKTGGQMFIICILFMFVLLSIIYGFLKLLGVI